MYCILLKILSCFGELLSIREKKIDIFPHNLLIFFYILELFVILLRAGVLSLSTYIQYLNQEVSTDKY